MEKIKNGKKLLYIVTFCILISGMTVFAANDVGVSDNGTGTVNVTYNNKDNKKIAIRVIKSGSSTLYTYYVSGKTINLDVPMTLGNGTYKISVYKNTTGNSYTKLSEEMVKLNLSNDKMPFLSSSQLVDWNTKNEAIKQATKLVKDCKTDNDKIKQIYKYIVENFSYDFDKYKTLSSNADYIPDIDKIYKAKKGICYDISSLMASMLRSQSVATKLVTGYPTNPSLPTGTYHAWNKAYDSAKSSWIIIDATTDMQLYKKVDYSAMAKKSKEYSKEKYVY